MSRSEQDAIIEECFAYDDLLVDGGHWVDGGQALERTPTAKTLRWKDGKVVVTDGPFAETKEQLGGLGVLHAQDMAHAVELIAKHPGVRLGPFEIRPIDEEMLKRVTAEAEAASSEMGKTKRFACLGYIAESSWEGRSRSEFDAMIQECIAFDTARQRDGHWINGIALQSATTAKTVRAKGNQVLVTDGPFAETKEQLGGVVVNQFQDMSQAVGVLSAHPALRYGLVLEIRPADEDFDARWEARQKSRRAEAAAGIPTGSSH
jgi:hypothetical protein